MKEMKNNMQLRPFAEALDSLLNEGIFNFLGADGYVDQPLANLHESEDSYIVEMSIPGIPKEKIEINITKNTLSVKGNVEQEEETKEKTVKRREFKSQSFERSFRLPKNIDLDKIKANHKEGILSIEISKKEKEDVTLSKNIEIS